MCTITDVYNRCLEYLKFSQRALYPATVESIVQRLKCTTEISDVAWHNLIFNIMDETGAVIGHIQFEWYFSGVMYFYNEKYELVHIYRPNYVLRGDVEGVNL